jgi:phosphopantetheinyl transferase
LWVRKEAYLKGLGVGLLRPLERIECIVRSDGPDGIRDADDRDAEQVWRLRGWRPAADFQAAVAAETSLASLLISTFPP